MTHLKHWTLDDIPWRDIRRDLVAPSDALYYMVTTASLIESATHLYAHNLVAHFSSDSEAVGWLARNWEPEELQHGRALREYVKHVWPEFDWETVYGSFLSEFSAACKVDALLPQLSLELASRCVVEMGTASYYTALSKASGDPVLSVLAQHIFEDEVGHYKHFYKYFLRHQEIERTSRSKILGALWHRLKMIEGEDGYIALKYAYLARYPGRLYDARIYRRELKIIRKFSARHFPIPMSVKMLLKPLDLAPIAQHVAQSMIETFTKRVLV